MDRVVSQLLAEIDGIDDSPTQSSESVKFSRFAPHGNDVDEDDRDNFLFIIGATNRPDLVDQALLRPGRFDKLLYVGPDEPSHQNINGSTKEYVNVLRALTRKFLLADDIDFSSIAKSIPRGCTGADIYALCSDAWMHSAKMLINSDAYSTDPKVVVSASDFEVALSNLVPSLSQVKWNENVISFHAFILWCLFTDESAHNSHSLDSSYVSGGAVAIPKSSRAV